MIKKQVYVSLLSSDEFLEGALLLNQNLKLLQSKYPLIIICTNNLSPETFKHLENKNIKYKIILEVNNKKNFYNKYCPRWMNTISKIEIFNLVEYDRCVYLDLDLFILDNIDNLFLLQEDFYCNSVYKFSDAHIAPNSSILVFSPSKKTYDDLLEAITNNAGPYGDEFYIFNYFIQKQTITMLPILYDMTPGLRTAQNYQHIENITNIKYKIIHLFGEEKPWNNIYEINKYFKDRYYSKEIAELYSKLYKITFKGEDM